MNKYTADTFNEIKKYATEYKTASRQALMEYRSKLQKAREQANKYKDEREYLEQVRSAAALEARRAISSARYAFQTQSKYSIAGLREEVQDHITKNQPDAKFYETLRIYRDFELCPDETETEGLISMSRGSYLACRALNAVLEQTGSEYRVQTPSAETYNADLEKLEKLMAPGVLCMPMEYHTEAVDILKDQPYYRTTDADGNEIDTGYRYDSVSILGEVQSFDSIVRSLDDMTGRWTGSVLPSLIRYAAVSEADSGEKMVENYAGDLADSMTTAAKITPAESDKGIKLAKQLAQNEAAAAQRYDQAMTHYTAGR